MHDDDGQRALPDFNRRAATYAENADVQLRAAAWLAEWIEPDLPPETRMWELGSGTGFFTRELLRRGYRVLATDIAPEMVVHGKRACPEADWMIHDSWNLPAAVCDRLYSSSLLQWAPDLEKVLSSFRATLRPRGKMLHGFFVEPSLRELYALTPPEAMPLRWHTEDEWLAAFGRAGFRVLRAEAKTAVVRYASVEDFLKRLRDSGATAAQGKISAAHLRRVMKTYARDFSDGKNGVPATWRFLRVEAERRD